MVQVNVPLYNLSHRVHMNQLRPRYEWKGWNAGWVYRDAGSDVPMARRRRLFFSSWSYWLPQRVGAVSTVVRS